MELFVKNIKISNDIIPIDEFKTHASAILYKVKTTPSLRKDRLLVAVDDAQRIAQAKYAFGEAMATFFSQCRQYNMSALISATNLGKMPPEVKQNISVFLIFENDVDKEKFWKLYNINIDEDLLQEKQALWGKGTAIIKAPDFGYETEKIIHIDKRFMHQRKKKRVIRPLPPLDTAFVDAL